MLYHCIRKQFIHVSTIPANFSPQLSDKYYNSHRI